MSLESLGLTARFATEEEMRACDLYANSQIIVVVQNTNNELVCAASFNSAYRGMDCDACTGTCYRGGMLWTRPDMRGQGVFTGAVEWARSQTPIFPLYTHAASAQQSVLVSTHNEKYGLRKGRNLPPRTESNAEELVRILPQLAILQSVMNA